jgi:phage terminase small subunit
MPRPRTPTAILELNGTIAQRPQRYAKQGRANEPQVEDGIGAAPKYLTTDEKKIWAELRKTITWLTIADRHALEEYCQLKAKSRAGTIKPQERSVLKSYLASFGMTPSDRSKVNAPAKPKKTEDAYAFLDAPTDNASERTQ